jgi:Lon protease-like protein
MPVMPMFPLTTVLLPAMPLPLRIFEERYLKLLGDLLGQETPDTCTLRVVPEYIRLLRAQIHV